MTKSMFSNNPRKALYINIDVFSKHVRRSLHIHQLRSNIIGHQQFCNNKYDSVTQTSVDRNIKLYI